MKSEHTPGKWSTNDRTPATIIDENGYEIACLEQLCILDDYEEKLNVSHWAHHDKGRITRTDEEVEANAKLIAAAPALLEACQALIASYEFHCPEAKENSNAIKAGRQAIAMVMEES